MGKKLPLTDKQVREIVALAGKLEPEDIAAKFDRHPSTIVNILLGHTYKHVRWGRHQNGECSCRNCLINGRREENERLADAARLEGVCVTCGEKVSVRASALLGRPGSVACTGCAKGRGHK